MFTVKNQLPCKHFECILKPESSLLIIKFIFQDHGLHNRLKDNLLCKQTLSCSQLIILDKSISRQKSEIYIQLPNIFVKHLRCRLYFLWFIISRKKLRKVSSLNLRPSNACLAQVSSRLEIASTVRVFFLDRTGSLKFN